METHSKEGISVQRSPFKNQKQKTRITVFQPQGKINITA